MSLSFNYLISCILIASAIYLLFWMGRRDTMWSLRLHSRQVGPLGVVCCGNALLIGRSEIIPAAEVLSGRLAVITRVSICIFAGCLLVSCVMDMRDYMVYRYVWAVAGVSAVVLCIVQNSLPNLYVSFWGYALFALLQQALFARMYGRADCHAFCVCAAVLMAFRGSFSDYVMHMAVSFVILIIVQLCKRNVLPSGKLKIPVPMLPYITAGFWLWLDFGMQK